MPVTIDMRKLGRLLRPPVRLATLFVLVFSYAALVGTARAADSVPGQNNYAGRKVIFRVEPEYPTDLRSAGIGGYVHLTITINPSGAVVSSQIVGGNPILAQAAVRAVSRWKFSPAATTTSADIWLHFAQ